MSKVLVRNIYLEDLFKWFADHIIGSGGDGCAAIVCANFFEVANWFEIWVEEKNIELAHWLRGMQKDISGDTINIHDSNENWIFTRIPDISLCDGDYIFIVDAECKSARYNNREAKPVV